MKWSLATGQSGLMKLLRRVGGGQRHRGHQAGGVAVEMALCLLPLVILFGGIVDFGDAYYIKQVISNASREGARYGSRFQTDSSGNRVAPNNFSTSIASHVTSSYGSLVPNLTVPTPTGTGYTSGASGDNLTVTASAQKNWFFLGGLMGFSPQTLTTSTTMALE
jgi:Flp pilus assembly protein TadG